MSDLISRSWMMEQLDGLGDTRLIKRNFIALVKNAHTIDAVPVVRCWECKHCDPENYHCDHPIGTSAPLRRKPDDFCSYGERKDGDGNG